MSCAANSSSARACELKFDAVAMAGGDSARDVTTEAGCFDVPQPATATTLRAMTKASVRIRRSYSPGGADRKPI